jgi:hypothetical protein
MLVSVPISYVNVVQHRAARAAQEPGDRIRPRSGQVAAEVTLFLRLHNWGLVINQIFWGLWLFPIGALVMRSGFLPRWLGVPLFFAGAGYVIHSLGNLLPFPALRGITQYGQVLGVGELPLFSFYLLIWGVRGHAVDRLAALLVVLSFALGMGALVLLNLKRIDATQYAALELASLVVVVGLVMRWRGSEAAARTTVAVT